MGQNALAIGFVAMDAMLRLFARTAPVVMAGVCAAILVAGCQQRARPSGGGGGGRTQDRDGDGLTDTQEAIPPTATPDPIDLRRAHLIDQAEALADQTKYEEAIEVCTLNGARYLEIDEGTGSIAAGKAADLVVVEGNPAADIADIRKTRIVFKAGVGYDSQALFDSVKGTVGIR